MSQLKPLKDLDALDGDSYEAPIPRDQPLQRTCLHKDMKAISSVEIRCKCGVGYTGPGVLTLLKSILN